MFHSCHFCVLIITFNWAALGLYEVIPTPRTASNQPPVLLGNNTDYVIVNQKVPSRGVLHHVLVQDPEKGALFYSITGVTFFRNDTDKPITANDQTWVVKGPNRDDACSIAEGYPFPRNLFCIDATNNAIKATSKYSPFVKADFSLFRLDVVVYDGGQPQRNLTTRVYFRVKDNCSYGPSEYSAYQKSCSKYMPTIVATGQEAERDYTFVAKNDTVISRIEVKFLVTEPLRIEQKIIYNFEYFANRMKKLFTFTRRLLINTAKEQTLLMHLWYPHHISSDNADVSVSFFTIPKFKHGTEYKISMFRTSAKYCADSTCVGLYRNIEAAFRKTMQYECVRKEDHLFINKYRTCKVVTSKPPVWQNKNENYVFINKTSTAGTAVFSFKASDPLSKSTIIVYSIVGVTYYRNDSAAPVSRYDVRWAQTTAGTNAVSQCRTANAYPYPRNLFCINSPDSTIRTTDFFSKSQPLISSLYVLDVVMTINGKPMANTTGKVYIRIKNTCGYHNALLIADMNKCKKDAGTVSISGDGMAASEFNFTANYVKIHKMTIATNAFKPFNHIGKTIALSITNANTRTSLYRDSWLLIADPSREALLTYDVRPAYLLKGLYTLIITVDNKRLTTSEKADWPAIKLFTLPPKNYCSELKNTTCRVTYSKVRENLRNRQLSECLHYDVDVLFDGKYISCATAFLSSESRVSLHASRDLSSGVSLLTEKAISNDAVFYSITRVRYWKNDTSLPIDEKSSSWIVKTKSEAQQYCRMSEKYPFPRNLFCISQSGVLMPTSLYRNKLSEYSFVEIDIVASNSQSTRDQALKQVYLFMQPSYQKCEQLSATINPIISKCNNADRAVYPVQQKSNFYQYTAPIKASLIVRVGIRATILSKLNTGATFSLVLTRRAGKVVRIDRKLLASPADRKRQTYINITPYRKPVKLLPSEVIMLSVYSDSGVTHSNLSKNIAITTAADEEHCLTSCFDSYNRVVSFGGERAPRFPCFSPPLSLFLDEKYGRCYANSPPLLRTSNIVLSTVKAGAKIGRITGIDKESPSLRYGILSISSALLERTQSYNLTSKQSCDAAIKKLAPLSYVCVSEATGDVITTSEFPHAPGEVLNVSAFVIDAGSPKRYAVKNFTISIRDPCPKVRAMYNTITGKNCFSGSNRVLFGGSSRFSQLLRISGLNFDNIVFLEVSPTVINFPNNTMYSIFTIRVILAIEPSTRYGKSYNVTLSRSNLNAKSAKIPVHIPVNSANAVEISAVAIVDVSGGTTANNQANLKLVTVLLNRESLRIFGQSFREFCGNIDCVKTFNTWKEESRKIGLKICQTDPLQAREYFRNCSDPPSFASHPSSINTKLKSSLSLSCSYQNFTNVRFEWIKDNRPFVSELAIPDREHRSDFPPRFSRSIQRQGQVVARVTTKTLSLMGTDPEMQGYYSCRVKDALNHVVTSKPSLLRFHDVSSSKMKMKINQKFTNTLKDPNSSDYKKFSKAVTATINSKLDSRGLPANRKIAVSNIRPGSVLVDANVYFMNLTDNSGKQNICNGLQNISSDKTSSDLQVSSLDLVAYDCCYGSQTGDVQIKGVIDWQSTVADSFDRQRCPYQKPNKANQFATRHCAANFSHGAQWLEPNITACAYKTKTTQKLDDISKTKIDASNAESISSELDSVTSTTSDITNRLDVKFTADTINNLVQSRQKLKQITNDIINTTSNIMEVSSTIIANAQSNYNSSSKMLTSLDLLANSVPINQTTPLVAVRKNVALAIKVITKSSGILIKATPGNQIGYNNLTIAEASYDEKSIQDSTATIYLTPEMLQKVFRSGNKSRIFSFVFENNRLFLSKSAVDGNENSKQTVDSRILSASVGDIKLENLTYKEEVTALFDSLSEQKGKVECVFWDFAFQDGFGAWSSNGCRSDGMQGNMHRCRCNHLTNFAILLDVTGKGTPKSAALALSIITYIGCGVSLAGLVITFLTFVIFKKLREKRPPRILICLCSALIATLVIFLAGLAARDMKSCQAVGVLIHYFVLVSFCWMAVEGFNLYRSFVTVFPGGGFHSFILKCSIFAWGVPAVIVAITAGVTELEAYGEKRGDEWLCMITGIPFYVAYLAPILTIVLGNLVVLVYVLKSLSKSAQASNKDKSMSLLRQARIAAACSVLMGTTWIIGLFAIDVLTLPMQILFCIFNSLQGLFIFVFYCLRNADAMKQWKSVCCHREADGSKVTSSQGQYKKGSSQDAYKKGFSSDKAAASNKMFSNQSKKRDEKKATMNNLPMESFGKSTMTTTLPSATSESKTAFLRHSQLSEDGSNSNGSGSECELQSSEKPKLFEEDSAEMHFGYEPIKLNASHILQTDTTDKRL